MKFSKAVIVTTLLVLAPPCIAQAEEPETADTQTPSPSQSGPAQSSPETAPSRNEQSAESASDAAAQTESSPYDYESTEQISEDRSVSFPVDI